MQIHTQRMGRIFQSAIGEEYKQTSLSNVTIYSAGTERERETGVDQCCSVVICEIHQPKLVPAGSFVKVCKCACMLYICTHACMCKPAHGGPLWFPTSLPRTSFINMWMSLKSFCCTLKSVNRGNEGGRETGKLQEREESR